MGPRRMGTSLTTDNRSSFPCVAKINFNLVSPLGQISLWSTGIIDSVVGLIDSWTPKGFRSEDAYQEDLYKHLLSTVRHHEVTSKTGRSHADIGIGAAVGIEMKYNLDNKPEVDRLFAQLADHLNSYSEGVICVFCGHTQNTKIEYLKTLIRTRLARRPEFLYPTDRIRFVFKGILK